MARELRPERVAGRKILEIGSHGYGIRQLVELGHPSSYIGVDIRSGLGVDIVCPVEGTLLRFGPESFDVILSTELLEHVHDWRVAVGAMKSLCRPDGLIVLTTRSQGCPYHGRGGDFWRFEVDDLRRIFSDCRILALEADPRKPGVFLAVQKPATFVPADVAGLEIFSMGWARRIGSVPDRNPLRVRLRIAWLRFRGLFRHQLDVVCG